MAQIKVIKCPKCGNIQLTQAQRGTQCKRCGKSFSFFRLKYPKTVVVIYKEFKAEQGIEATAYIRELKKRLGEKK